ncbi:MAG: tRNA 2-thiouridine(34) synthase MnmA, partial [Deltaproteobacteria bacterium]|nr:tRNA 2-thiouridine(34) synthase MnmA [Deltaproteobacteria bacterium]
GGVDSSVAAALVVEAGHEAIGVTLQLAGSASRCCSLADADDARRVAERLGIRFFVANYKKRFDREIKQAFADAYLAGRTPIPCVSCNSRFKFEYLLERARVFGAERVVSGHYARVDRDAASGRYRLRRALDRDKDQTYFLFELTQEQLAAVDFPLGGHTKAAVRDEARRLRLFTAEKPESQEICFVPDGDYAAAVERIRPDRLPGEGDIVDTQGRRVGRHAGVHRFTVGQRRGIGVATGDRIYVTRIDAEHNRVVVGERAALLSSGAELEGVNWIAGEIPTQPVPCRVRIRYRDGGTDARVVPGSNGRARVEFSEPVAAVAPGQAAVFDHGDVVLGGGWIARATL